MTKNARGAARGSIGFGLGTLVATSFALLGFPFAGLILGGAIAGTLLAWKAKPFRLILLAALGGDLGLLLGGGVVVMSFGVLMEGRDSVLDQPTLGDLLVFYFVFIVGFAVAGATISVITVSRLVSLLRGVSAFAAGGVIGGAIIVAAEVMKTTTAAVVFAAVAIAVIVAGALCGASLNSSEEVSLSILERDQRLGGADRRSSAVAESGTQ